MWEGGGGKRRGEEDRGRRGEEERGLVPAVPRNHIVVSVLLKNGNGLQTSCRLAWLHGSHLKGGLV